VAQVEAGRSDPEAETGHKPKRAEPDAVNLGRGLAVARLPTVRVAAVRVAASPRRRDKSSRVVGTHPETE